MYPLFNSSFTDFYAKSIRNKILEGYFNFETQFVKEDLNRAIQYIVSAAADIIYNFDILNYN
jgi:hypothetical protein